MHSISSRIARSVALAAFATALVVPVAAAAPSDQADCVGQFSRYYAQGGSGTHRSAVARGFAEGAHPAGLNVYSQVANGHGSLESCFEQFS